MSGYGIKRTGSRVIGKAEFGDFWLWE